MNKSLSVMLLCALAAVPALRADHVAPSRASEIAAIYVSEQSGSPSSLSVKDVESINDNLYLVHFSPKGFAIVSSDDNAEPIVGYSLESNMQLANMPENMAYIMSDASKVVANKAANGTVNAKWSQIERRQMSRATGEPVEPLISVNWNQTSPFNKYCPGEGKNQAIVGCVAVAMSQAMSVQRYPVKPQGYASYNSANYGTLSIDYDKEADYDWNAILAGSNKYDEVARLLYHAGVSVSMDYGVDGSGIPSNQVYRITNALKNNFGYPDVAYYQRDSYKGDWEQLLLNELTAGHALVYNAIDSKGGYGHSFNIDGYNGTLYHLNWGWGGYGNGYFSINALSDAQMGMNYDSWHYAVTGIGAPNSPLRNIALSDLVVEEDTPSGSAVAALLVNGSLPTADMKVEITGEYDKNTGSYKEVPFTYRGGILYTKSALTAQEKPVYLRVNVTMKVDGNTMKLTQGFNMQICGPLPIENRTSISYDRATQTFSVHSKFGAEYVVKNSQGTVITQGTISENPEFQFSRADLTPGNNTVQVSSNGKQKVLNLSL